MKCILLTTAIVLAVSPLRAQDTAAVPDGGVYELASVETMPRPVNAAELRAALEAGYPAELRAAGRQGTVMVALVVSPEGETRDVRIVSSTDAAFDSATVAAVRVLRFTPAAVAGRPVAVRVELPIQWQAVPAAPALSTAPEPTATGSAAVAKQALAPAGERGYELSEVEVQPRPRNIAMLRYQLERLYPPALRDRGRGGTVQVRIRVGADGKVQEARVVSSTHVDFDRATLEAVRHLEFSPAQVNGHPVPVWVQLPIQWDVTGLSPNRMP